MLLEVGLEGRPRAAPVFEVPERRLGRHYINEEKGKCSKKPVQAAGLGWVGLGKVKTRGEDGGNVFHR